LVSDNDDQRSGAGSELYDFVQKLPGVQDPRTDAGQVKATYQLKIDDQKLAELGLSVMDVATTVRTAYEGNLAFSIRKDNEDVDHRIILAEKFRKNVDYLLELPIRNKMGKLVRLKQFASLQKSTSVLEINRYDGQRTYSIYAELDPKELTSMDAKKKILRFFKQKLANKYPEVEVLATGEAEETKKSMQSLSQSFLLAVLGIYFLLVLLFNSFSQPFFVLSAIPFGFVGIIWAFYFHGQNLSFPGMMGFIGLAGVVVNDSLIMVNYINKKSEKITEKAKYIASVVEGAGTRLRPILLTTITTVLGVIPTVYGWGGTDFILVPMTISLGYGLAFATVITLFLVPILTVVHKDFIKIKVEIED
jgi:multidrug efflux pump subunit AcrB